MLNHLNDVAIQNLALGYDSQMENCSSYNGVEANDTGLTFATVGVRYLLC